MTGLLRIGGQGLSRSGLVNTERKFVKGRNPARICTNRATRNHGRGNASKHCHSNIK